MHLLYVVRPGNDNEELRYSLRSLQNLPLVTSVTVVGDHPSWMVPDQFVKGNPNKLAVRSNGPANIRLAVDSPRVPDEFYLMNDDFYITAPVTEVVPMHRGSLHQHWRRRTTKTTSYAQTLLQTEELLKEHGVESSFSYEVHVPMLMTKERLAQVFEEFGLDGKPKWIRQYRSLYGNFHAVGGTEIVDPKEGPGVNTPYHSGTDSTFAKIERNLHQRFPEPSRFER